MGGGYCCGGRYGTSGSSAPSIAESSVENGGVAAFGFCKSMSRIILFNFVNLDKVGESHCTIQIDKLPIGISSKNNSRAEKKYYSQL